MNRADFMLRKKDVAMLLDVSMGKIDLLMKEGMKYYKFGRSVRFSLSDVNEYLETKTINTNG
jgi:excisionase family DNA binding protein